jgi:basic membrane lipoprotein Med (substrate-binding protein (PBP1-ABC) superfamily)
MYIEKYHPTISVGDTVAKDFLAHIYNPFREIYLKEGGGQLPITTGDALLDFLKIYGLPHEIVPFEHTDTIKKLIAELEVMTTDEANVQQQPLPTLSLKKRSVFQSMTHLMSAKKVLKIAFVYAKTPESSGWANCHELGRQHLENIFQNTIQTTAICDVPENEQAYPILENLAKEGYDIIFTTSPTFVAPSLKAAMQFPRTKFFSCAATKSYKSLTLYFGRIHEPKYLLGMIAGSLTQTNQIGYVAPYPISEVISSINAFTLGAQAVNPYVKVKAKWSYRWDNSKEIRNVENVLLEEGVDIIANDDLPVPGRTSKQYGVYAIDRQTGEKTHYAMAIWDWGAFYEKVIGNYLKGTWERIENPSEKEDNPMNFWLGMDTGIVDILYSNRHLSWPTKYLLDQMRQAIIRQNFKIFKGPIYANDRLLKVKENETCGYEEIINMDWFVEGVETIVPEIDHLTPSDPFLFMQTIIDKKE